MSLCKYKDALGKPNEGIHKYRFFNIAIADVTMTIIAAFIFSYIFKFNFLATLIILFLLGIILHRIFCVRTTVDKILFS
jgi:fatty acid desaturase